MATDITLPSPGEGVDSGEVVEILVNVGDTISRDQEIIQLATGKATLPVPADAAGKITKIYVQKGQTISVGAPILAVDGAPAAAPKAAAPPTAAPPAQPPAQQPAAPQPAAAKPQPAPQQAPPQQPAPPQPAQPVQPAPQPVAVAPPSAQPAPAQPAASAGGDVAAGPAVRRFAREVGVDLRNVSGSGEMGRVTRDDVLRAVREHAAPAARDNGTATATESRPAPAPDNKPSHAGQSDKWGPVHVEKMTQMRKAIATQMHKSWSTVPRVTNFDDADVTELERIRSSSKDDYAKRGLKLTTMPFLIKAVAMALREHPAINASIDMERDEIVYKEYVNIGIAVDTEKGLVVPPLRQPDRLSISEITRDLATLAEKVRESKYSLADLQGGTFTISNLGAIGGTYSTPIVNIPEVAILLVGRSRQMPVVIDGKVEVRFMMPMSLSYDHRLVDGATAARFLNDVIGYLKAPSRLLLAP